MIDFSAIPTHPKTATPLSSCLWALALVVSILGILALGAYVTTFTGHRDGVLQCLSALMFFGFIGAIVWAGYKSFTGFQQQKQWMRTFAYNNGWQYNDSPRTVLDLAAYPLQYTAIAGSWSKVRCSVWGQLYGANFELAHITYTQSTGVAGVLLSNASTRRFAWTSVLRVEGHPPITKHAGFYYEQDDSYTYVICGLNALYRQDVEAMFSSIAP